MRKSRTLARVRNNQTVRMCCRDDFIPKFVKLPGDPAVQALAGHDRSLIDLTVKFRGNPRQELAGVMPKNIGS